MGVHIRFADMGDKTFIKNLDKENMVPIMAKYCVKYSDEIYSNFKPKNCFIIEINDVMMGFAYFYNPGNKLDIWSIQIKKECSNKGYGKMLMNHLIEYAKKKHIKKIILGAHKENIAAINFYKKLGFVEVNSKKENKAGFELSI